MKLRHLALLSLLLPLAVYAKDDNRSWYVEGSFGQSNISQEGINASEDTTDGAGFNASLGYMFNKYFGLEGGYTQYANADFTSDSTTGSDERTAMDIVARVVWPFKEKMQIFTKLGMGSVTSDLSEELTREDNEDNSLTNNNLYYGIGFGYKVNKSFMLNGQYNTIKGSDTVGDSTLISFGATLLLSAD